jgi:putative PIN family toxin of toxin-antitoxin system
MEQPVITRIRVILDVNVLLSYLLTSDVGRTVTLVVRSCLTGMVELILPDTLFDELARTLTTKPYFQQRVTSSEAEVFIQQLRAFRTVGVDPLSHTSFSRDPNDDYLIVYGLVNDVDFLVTGDNDLLVLKRIGNLQIVTPAGFLTHFTKYFNFS